MFILGFGVGLLLSQIGNINMSAVNERDTSEVGGMQGVFQNLGSSVGTAIIGSVLVGALTTSFVANVQTSNLPANVKNYVQTNSQQGVSIVSLGEVEAYATAKGMPANQVTETVNVYAESQIRALKSALFALFVIALLSLVFSRNIPNKIP